jgi:enamidase
MGTLAIVNIGTLLTGDLERGVANAETLLCRGGLIEEIGRRDEVDVSSADVIVDAHGSSVGPGLIDSHCHVVLGDYTPRQQTVGFLESYVHGGITSVISAGEIHAPGRPRDAAGLKALAVAARACFLNFQPNGMKVHAGAIIIEPSLSEKDFQEVAEQGVWLAKFGFGAFADPAEGEAHVRWAQKAGIMVMCHSGGASLPDSKPITGDHLLHLRPDVCGHVNGGTTSLESRGLQRLVAETDLVLQIVQAGNVRSTIEIVGLAREQGALKRVIIGSDTPTGTGVMPLGVLKTVCEVSSLCGLPPDQAWALASGNNARVYRLNTGIVQVGCEADLVVMDAPLGCLAPEAVGAIARGDIPGISAVIISGVMRCLRSRNTPLATRMATVTPPMPWLSESH